MERRYGVSGRNRGAAPVADQPKVVAVMPEDKNLEDPKEAAKKDGYPGSCQL